MGTAVHGATELTLKDRLSRLTYLRACTLLGPEGAKLIREGGMREIDLDQSIRLSDEAFTLTLPDAVATIAIDPAARDKLAWHCTACRDACEHVGAAFSLVLEEKMSLGLAAAPPERAPVESLSEEQLVRQALADREERAQTEKMRVQSADPSRLWTDYTVTNAVSGKTYRVALRGSKPGECFCTCPDFRTNTLGVCKHVLHVQHKMARQFPASARKHPYVHQNIAVSVSYGRQMELRWLLPDRLKPEAAGLVSGVASRPIRDAHDLARRIAKLTALGEEVTVYPDAEALMSQMLFQESMAAEVARIRANPAAHPLRKTLLKVELLPYQLDGIAFAAGAGRAILADDMGLGKTIQGIGVAELLARQASIRRVLVVCPTTLKSQWRNEIERFSERDCQLVLGPAAERPRQYSGGAFFTICNYEQVLRDLPVIEQVAWDLIILDEAQRIKNWEAKTSRVIKGLASRFALALSGTPLENRLDELYSVIQFIDDRRLGPAFRFFNHHRMVDEKGRVLGYKNLAELRQQLAPVLLRRTRASVMSELPARTTEIVRIAPTTEQLDIHDGHKRIVASIVAKKFISEMDLLRLQKALLMCRMSANSTFLVNKEPPGYSSKLERIAGLLDELARERDRKTVLFSEWTTMLGLIEPMIEDRGMRYVRLDGSVPQKKRQQLVNAFQRDRDCRFFVTTNAGATGLNLQAANTVINVDLPWNPAVLEQRIARAHRMGQKRPVQVYVLVTEQTIEESLLTTLAAKQDLALAALDAGSDVDVMKMTSGIEEMKRRMEVLLGARPAAPPDVRQAVVAAAQTEAIQRRERIAAAGGQLLTAALGFLGQLLPGPQSGGQPGNGGDSAGGDLLVQQARKHLEQCVERDEAGRLKLTVSLPDDSALETMAASLARVLALR
ncbi:MAG: SNF2-related protein [Phycisphaerae bacterium]|nr:SNF2-related protein [Phycisphaerae bacterium]